MRSWATILTLLVPLTLAGPASTPPSPPASQAAPAAGDQQRLLNDVSVRLGGDLAGALSAEIQLSQALQQNAQQQDSLQRSLLATTERIAQLDASIAARQAEIEATQARIVAERAALAALARELYREPGSLLERLAHSGNLRDALTSTADLEAAGRRGGQLETALVNDLASLQAAQDQQRAERQKEADLQASQQRSLAALATLGRQEEQTAGALAAAIGRMRGELAVVGRQDASVADSVSKELETEQLRITAAAEQEAWSQVAIELQANPGALAQAGGSDGQQFIWPLPQGVVTQGFGPSDLALEPPYAGYPHFHTGVDLAAPYGSPVLAAAAGVVAVVGGGTTGYGNYVVVAHPGGVTTLYGHLAVAAVAGGQAVEQGQPVGLEGSTGNSTGPHCHFEVRVAGQPVDPIPFLPSARP